MRQFHGLNRHLLHHLVVKGDLVARSLDGNNLCLITHITELQLVLRIYYAEGEVSVDIRLCGCNNTVAGVNLQHITTHDGLYLILHNTVNHGACSLG